MIPMIPMKKFYGIAGILFAIVLLANLWNLILNWSNMNLPSKISFIFGSVFFNLMLFILFIGFWKITPKDVKNKDLDNLLKEYSKGGKYGSF